MGDLFKDPGTLCRALCEHVRTGNIRLSLHKAWTGRDNDKYLVGGVPFSPVRSIWSTAPPGGISGVITKVRETGVTRPFAVYLTYRQHRGPRERHFGNRINFANGRAYRVSASARGKVNRYSSLNRAIAKAIFYVYCVEYIYDITRYHKVYVKCFSREINN